MSTQYTATSCIQAVSPQDAQRMLETMQYERQRAINQHRVDGYAAAMKSGDFVPYTQIRIAQTDLGEVLIDGQHRLWAVILSDTTQMFNVLRTAEKSDETIAWTYGNIDIGQRRTADALVRALDLAHEVGLTQTQVSKMWRSFAYLASGANMSKSATLRRNTTDNRLYVDLVRLYAPLVAPFWEIPIPTTIRDSVQRSSTLTLIMLTYRYKHPRTHSFWDGLISDDGLSQSDPRKVANKHLISTRLFAHNNRTGQSVVSADYSIRYLAQCYNAHLSRKSIVSTRVMNEQAPLAAMGVPTDSSLWVKP